MCKDIKGYCIIIIEHKYLILIEAVCYSINPTDGSVGWYRIVENFGGLLKLALAEKTLANRLK